MDSNSLHNYARHSLAFLWLFTALTSVIWGKELGYQVLVKGNITGGLAELALYGGAILDLVIGIWLLTKAKLRLCYQLQITVIVIYSILLTFIDATFWLHPFGPLTKNIPILLLIGILMKLENANNE